MPTYPDDCTLRLRPVIQHSPAELADVARRGMRHRLTPTFADVSVPATVRTLRSFRQGQPWAAERFTDAELRAVAKPPPAGCCWWGIARLDAAVHRERPPRWRDPYVRALLGVPCAGCRAILDPPKPKPKPKAKAGPAVRKRARSSTATRRRRPAPAELAAATSAGLTAAAHGGVTPAQARYNREAMRRLGMDPATAPHLTRARP